MRRCARRTRICWKDVSVRPNRLPRTRTFSRNLFIRRHAFVRILRAETPRMIGGGLGAVAPIAKPKTFAQAATLAQQLLNR